MQAAAYICQRTPRYSVRKYLEKYYEHQSKSKINLLFCDEGGRLRRDVEAKMSIVVTWLIAVEHIREYRKTAIDLLALMSLFDRQGIPEELIQAREEVVEEPERQERSQNQRRLVDGGEIFEDDILVLKNYSLVRENIYQSFEMHRMVQNAMLDWLDFNGWLELCKDSFIQRLYLGFPNGHHETWARCRIYLPHAKSALVQKPKARNTMLVWSCLMIKTARYAYMSGKFGESEHIIGSVLETRVQLLDLDDELTVESYHIAALTFLDQEKWSQAEEVLVRGLEASRRVWGEEHVVTLDFTGYLTRLYLKQEKWDLAKRLQLKVEATSNKIVDDTLQPSAAQDYNRTTNPQGLVCEYLEQGDPNEKLDLWRQTLEVMNLSPEEYAPERLQAIIDQPGENRHLDRRTTLQWLANTYFQQGKYDDALHLWERALDIMEHLPNKDEHATEILQVKNDLASTYIQKQELQKAMDLLEEVLAGRRKYLGDNHPLTLTIMIQVAMLKKGFGQFEESRRLFEDAFRMRKEQQQQQQQQQQLRNEGDTANDLIGMNALIGVYVELNEWSEAEQLQREVLASTSRLLGETHPDTLSCLSGLAIYLYRLDRMQDAIAMMRKCLGLRRKVLGRRHPDTQFALTVLTNLSGANGEEEEEE